MTIAAEMQQAYLFQGIPPSEVEKAAPCAQEASYEPGEYIYKAGDSGQAFYIIAEGKVELTTRVIDNPDYHPEGDFRLSDGMLYTDGWPRLTFSGIGVYSRDLFAPCCAGSRTRRLSGTPSRLSSAKCPC